MDKNTTTPTPTTAPTTTTTTTTTTKRTGDEKCLAICKRQKIHAVEDIANHWITSLVGGKEKTDFWLFQILYGLSMEELSTVRITSHFFDVCWQRRVDKRRIRIPEDVQTLERANRLASLISTKVELSLKHPLKIMLGKGVHIIVGNQFGRMKVTGSYIIFVGKGKDDTIIIGGFKVDNNHHVKFEELTITNQSGPRAGSGLSITGGDTTVEVSKCIVKKCGGTGMSVYNGATVTASQCDFAENGGFGGVYCSGVNTKVILNDCTMRHNGGDGLYAYYHVVVDLHGPNTDIHFNNDDGIFATDRAKVNIHLPSQYNTTHDNVEEDRRQELGGSIANINADGTFTHVVEDD